jgi:hypothetical protein
MREDSDTYHGTVQDTLHQGPVIIIIIVVVECKVRQHRTPAVRWLVWVVPLPAPLLNLQQSTRCWDLKSGEQTNQSTTKEQPDTA